MNKLIIFTILICCTIQAHSQTDSLWVKYEQKTIENSKLKDDLGIVKQNYSDLSNAYNKDTLALQKHINSLQKDIEYEKQKVSKLNKNKVKAERDVLRHQVDSLNIVISTLNKTISSKNKEIATVKETGELKAHEEKKRGKEEALASIVDLYKNKLFDDLIESSTRMSIERDMLLVGNYTKVKTILHELQIYFNAEELLAKKFIEEKTTNAHMQLSQIKRESKRLNALKDDLEYYKDFNNALKETISKLINLDKHKSAGGDSAIQKLKYNDVITILSDYMYNYYDFVRYSYLSDIILEVIKRKKSNADTDIIDLLKKLE